MNNTFIISMRYILNLIICLCFILCVSCTKPNEKIYTVNPTEYTVLTIDEQPVPVKLIQFRYKTVNDSINVNTLESEIWAAEQYIASSMTINSINDDFAKTYMLNIKDSLTDIIKRHNAELIFLKIDANINKN